MPKHSNFGVYLTLTTLNYPVVVGFIDQPYRVSSAPGPLVLSINPYGSQPSRRWFDFRTTRALFNMKLEIVTTKDPLRILFCGLDPKKEKKQLC